MGRSAARTFAGLTSGRPIELAEGVGAGSVSALKQLAANNNTAPIGNHLITIHLERDISADNSSPLPGQQTRVNVIVVDTVIDEDISASKDDNCDYCTDTLISVAGIASICPSG